MQFLINRNINTAGWPIIYTSYAYAESYWLKHASNSMRACVRAWLVETYGNLWELEVSHESLMRPYSRVTRETLLTSDSWVGSHTPCVLACLLARVRACLLACVRACLRACLLACLLARVRACLLACLLACVRSNSVRACLRACLLACLLACVLACLRACVRAWLVGTYGNLWELGESHGNLKGLMGTWKVSREPCDMF